MRANTFIVCAAAFLVALCACRYDPALTSADRTPDGGYEFGRSALVEPAPICEGPPSRVGPAESAGGAECITADGAPFVASKC
jgi:hypothetical protein